LYTVFLGIAALQLLTATLFVNPPAYLKFNDIFSNSITGILFFVARFESIWSFGLILFAGHLFGI